MGRPRRRATEIGGPEPERIGTNLDGTVNRVLGRRRQYEREFRHMPWPRSHLDRGSRLGEIHVCLLAQHRHTLHKPGPRSTCLQ